MDKIPDWLIDKMIEQAMFEAGAKSELEAVARRRLQQGSLFHEEPQVTKIERRYGNRELPAKTPNPPAIKYRHDPNPDRWRSTREGRDFLSEMSRQEDQWQLHGYTPDGSNVPEQTSGPFPPHGDSRAYMDWYSGLARKRSAIQRKHEKRSFPRTDENVEFLRQFIIRQYGVSKEEAEKMIKSGPLPGGW